MLQARRRELALSDDFASLYLEQVIGNVLTGGGGGRSAMYHALIAEQMLREVLGDVPLGIDESEGVGSRSWSVYHELAGASSLDCTETLANGKAGQRPRFRLFRLSPPSLHASPPLLEPPPYPLFASPSPPPRSLRSRACSLPTPPLPQLASPAPRLASISRSVTPSSLSLFQKLSDASKCTGACSLQPAC